MPFSIKDIPEDAYTFMTNFNLNDSYIDNDELLRLCRFNEKLHVKRPRVRSFSQVCKYGEDVRRISGKANSLPYPSSSSSSSSSSSLSINSLYQNSKFINDFSKMNTNSIVTSNKNDKNIMKKNFNYQNTSISNVNDGECYDVEDGVLKENFIFDSSIDERCFNGEYIEPDNTRPSNSIPTTITKFRIPSFTRSSVNNDSDENKIPLEKEDTDFWRHLSQQEF